MSGLGSSLLRTRGMDDHDYAALPSMLEDVDEAEARELDPSTRRVRAKAEAKSNAHVKGNSMSSDAKTSTYNSEANEHGADIQTTEQHTLWTSMRRSRDMMLSSSRSPLVSLPR